MKHHSRVNEQTAQRQKRDSELIFVRHDIAPPTCIVSFHKHYNTLLFNSIVFIF
jgi:hypothetical protein